ncbi:hypothetical protein GCM10027174_14230 [Salinifilum aidingensis]
MPEDANRPDASRTASEATGRRSPEADSSAERGRTPEDAAPEPDATGPAAAGEVPVKIPDLAAGIGRLPNLLLGTAEIDEVLWETALLAVRADETVESCGVTVIRDDALVSILPDRSPHAKLENTQYAAEDGPILEAMREHHPVLVSSTATERRWGEYPRHAREAGIGSSLTLPMLAGDKPLGAITLYSSRPRAFPEHHVLGTLVANLAATGLWCLLRHADKQRMEEQLQQALTSREVVDQAKGIIMAQRGCDAREAFSLLRRTSQDNNIKLRDVARKVVDRAVGGDPAVETPPQ